MNDVILSDVQPGWTGDIYRDWKLTCKIPYHCYWGCNMETWGKLYEGINAPASEEQPRIRQTPWKRISRTVKCKASLVNSMSSVTI